MNPIPYGFQPIDTTQAVHDAPLWRDGKSSESRLSGEILITLTAKTPLIVGNHQHKIDDQHSQLVPQMLDDGRVLLAASSLKGMLRSAIASLLHAPMERVGEHHYSYRPNLGFGPKLNPNREVRAAVVQSIEVEGATATVRIQLLPKDCAVVFVRDDARPSLGNSQAGERIRRVCSGVKLTGDAPRMRLEPERKSNLSATLDHYAFLYRGGMDGEGNLAKAFSSNGGVYRQVLVPASAYEPNKPGTSIPAKVLSAYHQTQKILADDNDGHLSPGHPLASKLNMAATQQAIRHNTPLHVHQLIYVEIEHGVTPTGKAGILIRSMGHHFQYRWGYSSSVRYKNRLLDGKGELRAELALHPQEQAADHGAPQQLTASRLLFGYAIDGRSDEQKTLASGPFKRLAGRIAFNTAIEDTTGKSMEQRFIDGGGEIQLRILGMPRPSAVEFYLKQTALPKKLTTYGDLPGDPGGDLAGRKYYRHQPDARKDRQPYTANPQESNAEERGTCLRYLSSPGSRFRSTLRFDSLRPWELGALLVTLDPGLLEPLFGLPRHAPGYAHKLGYGKPLGLGSVNLALDAARWQHNDSWQWQQTPKDEAAWKELQQTSLAALKEKLQAAWGEKAKAHLESWLKTRRWSERGQAEYPTASDNRRNTTIFNYHTTLRRDHAAARRGANKDFSALKKLLETHS